MCIFSSCGLRQWYHEDQFTIFGRSALERAHVGPHFVTRFDLMVQLYSRRDTGSDSI